MQIAAIVRRKRSRTYVGMKRTFEWSFHTNMQARKANETTSGAEEEQGKVEDGGNLTVREMEQQAYVAVLRALSVHSPGLVSSSNELLSNLRVTLNISSEEHARVWEETGLGHPVVERPCFGTFGKKEDAIPQRKIPREHGNVHSARMKRAGQLGRSGGRTLKDEDEMREIRAFLRKVDQEEAVRKQIMECASDGDSAKAHSGRCDESRRGEIYSNNIMVHN